MDNQPLNQTTWRAAQVLGVSQLMKALELRGVYTMLWAQLTADQPMSLQGTALSLASVLFLLLPIMAVVALVQRRRWGFYPLFLFPVVATVFGAIPIPFVASFFSFNLMSEFIIGLNIIFIGIYLVLFRKTGTMLESNPRAQQ